MQPPTRGLNRTNYILAFYCDLCCGRPSRSHCIARQSTYKYFTLQYGQYKFYWIRFLRMEQGGAGWAQRCFFYTVADIIVNRIND